MKVLLDNLRSAHNVGSIIRTCDAFGIQKVIFSGITPGTDDPKVLKTSLGAERSIQPEIVSNTYDTVLKLKGEGYKVAALELSNKSIRLKKTSNNTKLVLIVGNEVSGISDEVLELCDTIYEIPMKGDKESLNVSVAFGIAAYELTG